MGGYGSGRRLGYTKTKVEDCQSLDANDFARRGFFKSGYWYTGTTRWTRNGAETGSCGYYVWINEHQAFITFSYNYRGIKCPDVKVNLSCYVPGFGGRRYFFLCPVCGQRKRTLHFKEGEIACRICHDLTYESCNESNRYNSLFKHMAAGTGASWQEIKGIMSLWAKEARREPKRPRGRPRKNVSQDR